MSISGADPLNLVGVIVPGAKVPALSGNRVLYLDGIAVATLVGGDICALRSAPAVVEAFLYQIAQPAGTADSSDRPEAVRLSATAALVRILTADGHIRPEGY